MLTIFFVVKGNKSSENTDILTNVKLGKFTVEIETTGELEAKNSVKILGPTGLRNYRIWNMSIEKIVTEGTEVKKGAWIASLDKSELMNKIQDAEAELDQKRSQFTQTQLDTALQMRQARDELVNLDYAVEEAEITLEQSKFEPPATIKQAEINVDKAKRTLSQAKENYKIKLEQSKAKMQEVAASLRKEEREYNGMMQLMQSFTILAPEDGMVIYRKGWDGKPIKEGSQISAWDPVVATLPDLSIMLSKTYVNEVDVRKVKPGQSVSIGLDAFPDKKLFGTVINVANVGEQRPNSDAKVFEVSVQVHGTDPLLRPSMTTSNSIVANEIDSAMSIPLETLHTQFDSITYVFKRDGMGIIKQEVMVGETNSDEAVILAGLDVTDRLYLSVPAGFEERQVALIPEMDGKRQEPEVEPSPIELEPTITLPDGRVVPASSFQRGGQRGGKSGQPRRGNRGGNRNNSSETKQTTTTTSEDNK